LSDDAIFLLDAAEPRDEMYRGALDETRRRELAVAVPEESDEGVEVTRTARRRMVEKITTTV
jgi:hypothetical protein